MNLNDFLLMRHELLLTILIVTELIIEVFSNRKRSITLSISLFFLVTLAGFLPIDFGQIFGGMYQTTSTIVFMKNILGVGTLLILLQSAGWLQKPENEGMISEYFALIYSSLIGMNLMISSGDFLMFYLGLELATIPVAALAAFDKIKRKSAEAGVKLILSSALSSGILLYGLSLIYGTTGSIYFSEVARSFDGNALQIIGFIFFVTGMGFKISLVPFHLWTADVYEGAPIGITSFLSVVSKGAATFIFIITLYTVFGSILDIWKDIIYLLAVTTMTVANLFALRQDNMKRFLAFSSIAQAGFILLGIIGASTLGMTSVIYFVLIYVFTNLAAFGVVAAVYNSSGKETIHEYNGLYSTNPKLSLLMTLSLFSLAGIPPVAGFFGKFFLFTSAASQHFYILVLIAVLNATISLYYYLKVVKAMFIDKSDSPIPYFKSDNYARIGLLICLAGIVIVGFASPLYEFIQTLSFGIQP